MRIAISKVSLLMIFTLFLGAGFNHSAVTYARVVAQSCQSGNVESRVQHTVLAEINYAQHIVMVRQRVDYVNTSGVGQEHVVMNVEAQRWQGAFALDDAGVFDQPADYALDGRRLEIALPEALPPGCEVVITLQFRLAVPEMGEGVGAYDGYFGHTARQLNLGHWLPTVAVWQDDDWVTRAASFVGEQDVLAAADWDVTLNIREASDEVMIGAPGVVERLNDTTWHYELTGGREFSASISDAYHRLSGETENGVTVEVYTFDDARVILEDGRVIDSAAHALEVGMRTVTMYSDLYGPYPYDRLVVIQADFPDGMEFSGMVFVGGSFFSRYQGNPAAFLTLITAHEIAHQWWYGRAGNDSASDPWLDESLATYSEYVFLEEFYPDLRNWWWDFRVNNYSPIGFVDSSVYEFGTIREYINAVYLRGARLLDDLRTDLGTDAFFEWLYAYADAADGQIATADLFWSLLTEDQLELTRETRERYLRQPEPTPLQDE
jgi:hypothetical protein